MYPSLIATERVAPIARTGPVAPQERSMRGPILPGGMAPPDTGVTRRLQGATGMSHRSRIAHASPLTGMGWAVVTVACGLLIALGAFALVRF